MGIMYLIKDFTKKIINTIMPGFLAIIRKKRKEHAFYISYKNIKNVLKIIYTLTPPKSLSNIGDHAQVVAINKWLKTNYPDTPIIEVDKDQCISMIHVLKKIVNQYDLIFIHSGGNLGDRGIWSEKGRRNIIVNFPNNKIVSLPQTIFFSDTEKGRKEQRISEQIYNSHKNLTIIGRDQESYNLAKRLFPSCRTFPLPDFVLYLKGEEILERRNSRPNGTLLCLRNDNESILTINDRKLIQDQIKQPFEYFDTTIDKPIRRYEREDILKRTIEYFDKFEIIITDRYHGLIFAALLRKPTIIIPTIDHKLTSAYDWFKNIRYIIFVNNVDFYQINNKIKDLLKMPRSTQIDWRSMYFLKLREQI